MHPTLISHSIPERTVTEITSNLLVWKQIQHIRSCRHPSPWPTAPPCSSSRDFPIIVQIDASKHDLGTHLLQNGKPIIFALKSLTDAETRNANIERKLLVVVCACQQFHTYLYSHFTVEIDDKPIEIIAHKSLNCYPQLQWMLLHLHQ